MFHVEHRVPRGDSARKYRKQADMKIRKGWRITWPDGTKWDGDCRRWAFAPLMPGATRTAIRIMGTGRWSCPECAHGTHR